MDKETLSNYGWIVICVLVLAVMLAFATPFGTFVADAVKSTTQGLFDVNQSALDAAEIIIDDQGFPNSKQYMIGDVNQDGKISNADITRLNAILGGKVDSPELTPCDVNQDGVVNLTDKELLQQYYLHGESDIIGTMTAHKHNIRIEYNGIARVGDVNQDGKISNADITRLNAFLGRKIDGLNLTACDVNNDNVVNQTDMDMLKGYYLGKLESEYIGTAVLLKNDVSVEYN